MLGQKQGTDGLLLTLKYLLKVKIIWIPKAHFLYCEEVTAVLVYCGEVLSPPESTPSVMASSSNKYVDLGVEAG